MHRGYIKLWRKSLDSIVWESPVLWRFWTWCLMKATHTKFKAKVGYNEIDLVPGQFIFGRKICSEETGLSEQTVRTCIKKMTRKLTIKSTNRFSVGTIINWKRYQPPKEESNQENNNQLTTYNNINNIYKKKEDFWFRKLVTIPDNIFLTDKMKAYVIEQGCNNGNHAKFLFNKFKNNHDSKGHKFKNWTAAFRTWVDNDKKLYNPDKYKTWVDVPVERR